jgi:hypothetical protein
MPTAPTHIEGAHMSENQRPPLPEHLRSSAGRPRSGRAGVVLALALASLLLVLAAPAAHAVIAAPSQGTPQRSASTENTGSSLESAAAKAGSTGRAVAMSLIGLAFAVAGTVLAFRRDFKEAAGVFAVGIVSVLLATPTGVSLLQDTVNSLFVSR